MNNDVPAVARGCLKGIGEPVAVSKIPADFVPLTP